MNSAPWILLAILAVGGLVALAVLLVRRLPTHKSSSETASMIAPPAERDPKLDDLWKYLESFRHSETMPSLSDVTQRFGTGSSAYEPQLVTSAIADKGREPLVGPNGEPCEYYRFAEADIAAGTIAARARRYSCQGSEEDELPWIDIYLSKTDGSVLGWEWAWMAPPGGNGMGPPRLD